MVTGETSVCLPAYVHTSPKKSSKKPQDTPIPEQESSQASEQPTTSVLLDSGSPLSSESQVKRKRRKKSIWFGLRRRSFKKKNLTDDIEDNRDIKGNEEGKCDEQEKDKDETNIEENVDENVHENNGNVDENVNENMDDNNENENVDGNMEEHMDEDDVNENKNVDENIDENEQCDDVINDSKFDNPSTSAPSPHYSSNSNECLQNGDIHDESSNSSSTKDKQDEPSMHHAVVERIQTNVVPSIDDNKEMPSSKQAKTLPQNLTAKITLTSLSMESLKGKELSFVINTL